MARSIALAVLLSACTQQGLEARLDASTGSTDAVELPPPRTTGETSLEEVLAARRSVRAYTDEPLTTEEIGQLFWSAQGVTAPRGLRTAPSAGRTYPLELYVATREGILHYLPTDHRAERVSTRDVRRTIDEEGGAQAWVSDAPAVFIVAAIYARTEGRYGARSERYVKMEVGHATQNLLLGAVALGLGAVVMGAFDDEAVRSIVGLPADQEPLALIPVGHPEG